ncbi:MAG: DNA mismatch repair endonuclease MutL [Clostridia bacterium]|nr:DNA mismatch repair endonuclease MutL [Clostridia bacterium]
MGKINVLGFELANLIAAGEVVDRPASVLKELLENAIDAGATRITAEIRRGGVTSIRVSDNGCGMTAEDLPVAILRHATSKIKTADDLAAIGTLGFRGEALAPISAVSEMRLISKTREAETGVMLTAAGGTVLDVCEVGAVDGTTVVVENLFENVPARRKFLKKDATETMASAAVVEKIAMSRPDIAFEMITDGTTRFKTEGDGDLMHTLYALHGKEYATRLVKIEGGTGGVRVSGYVGASDNVRQNRNHQNMFINGRYVKSKTVMAALEKAFTSYIAPERFPVCALFLDIHPATVDVNVHPAKLEVKFSDERVIFEAVYYAVRSALEENDSRPEWQFAENKQKKNPLSAFIPVGDDSRARQISAGKELFGVPAPAVTAAPAPVHTPAPTPAPQPMRREVPASTGGVREALDRLRSFREEQDGAVSYAPIAPAEAPAFAAPAKADEKTDDIDWQPVTPVIAVTPAVKTEETAAHKAPTPPTETQETPPYRIAGEVFRCYVIVELEKEILLIDKHAAHERILFEELKERQEKDGRVGSQNLLVPLSIIPAEEELAAAEEYRAEMEAVGFAYTVDRTARRAHITAVPDAIALPDAEELFIRMLADLCEGAGDPKTTEKLRREKTLYRVACRAAIKGGRLYGEAQTAWLVDRVMALPDITVCPHGRPVAIRMTKNQLDRQFDRIM